MTSEKTNGDCGTGVGGFLPLLFCLTKDKPEAAIRRLPRARFGSMVSGVEAGGGEEEPALGFSGS